MALLDQLFGTNPAPAPVSEEWDQEALSRLLTQLASAGVSGDALSPGNSNIASNPARVASTMPTETIAPAPRPGVPYAAPVQQTAPPPVQQAPAAETNIGEMLSALGRGYNRGGLVGAVGDAMNSGRAQESENMTVRFLERRGMDRDTATAMVRNPDLTRALLPQLMAPRTQAVAPGSVIVDNQGRVVFDNSDASRLQPGWRRGANGEMEPIPGGPADPAYLREANQARERPRQMSVNDIEKLDKTSQQFSQLRSVLGSFDNDYAGYTVPGAGNAAMAAGRYLPQSVAPGRTAEAASWWQEYNRYRNVVRNELFGAALTGTEQRAWEAADINPSMSPEAVKRNLEIQNRVVAQGIARKAGSLVSEGYNPETVARAFGLNQNELAGLGANMQRGTTQSTTEPTTTTNTPATAPGGFRVIGVR